MIIVVKSEDIQQIHAQFEALYAGLLGACTKVLSCFPKCGMRLCGITLGVNPLVLRRHKKTETKVVLYSKLLSKGNNSYCRQAF